jgi:hypothetical protein
MKFKLPIMTFFATLFIFFGCSTTFNKKSEHIVTYNIVPFVGGLKNNQSWDDHLDFHRISWFKGATMSYDLMIARLPADSPFRNWLDDFDQSLIKNCTDLFIGLTYFDHLNRKKRSTLTHQLETQGFKRLILTGFKEHLVNHPTYTTRHLFRHFPYAFCMERKEEIGKEMVLDFEIPGFPKKSITL